MSAIDAAPVFFGLRLYELLTLFGVFLGPIVAVLLTLWLERRRRDRDAKYVVLRMLFNSRHMVGDPAWSAAVNSVKLEFNNDKNVMAAWRAYMDAVRVQPTPGNEEAIARNTIEKQVKLIFQVTRAMDLNISETDLQFQSYVSTAFLMRDMIYLDSLKALRDLADTNAKLLELAQNAPTKSTPRSGKTN